ncbi:hypothetical protein [Paracoccus aerius]|uniref:Uncharacterized protein n=1 Tax=Paracoccus aerius TaxID=1915382 RepID=A0ABS1SAN4_9RHOB|nr:hypothetical protein [Paracoccus aerius]MBL3675599.1 hypothetical protein [Paracoccus aerius]GHG35591.1 hypothetical protein GCM10017322_38110 [Paracoccus aerius]
MHFNAKTGGFYSAAIHTIPKGSKEISDTLYKELLAGQERGGRIVAGKDGMPYLEERPIPNANALLEIERDGMAVSRFQARAALHLNGLLEAAETAVKKADPLVQLAWTDTIEWRRNSEMVKAI